MSILLPVCWLFTRIVQAVDGRNVPQGSPHQMRLHIASCQTTIIQQVSIPDCNSLHFCILHGVPILDTETRRVIIPDLMYITILIVIPKIWRQWWYIPLATCVRPGQEKVLDCWVGDLTACCITAVNTSEWNLFDVAGAIEGVKFFTGIVITVPW